MQVHELLGSRAGQSVWLVCITVDPQHDTPQILQEYRETWDCVKPGWLFLTGGYDDITRLRRSLGVYDLDPKIDADITQHAGILTFGNDRTNRWAGIPGLTRPGDIVNTVLRLTGRTLEIQHRPQ